MKHTRIEQFPCTDVATRLDDEELSVVIKQALAQLPSLPPSVRYYDDFEEKFRTIQSFDEAVILTFEIDGRRRTVDLAGLLPDRLALLKHIAVDMIGRQDAKSASLHLRAMSLMDGKVEALFSAALTSSVQKFRNIWLHTQRFDSGYGDTRSLKQILFSLCNLSIYPWNPDWKNYVRDLPSPQLDKYKAVQTGECFVPVDQQMLVVDYFDELAALVQTSPGQVTTDDLKCACMLLLSFQHGLRRGQIARIKRQDLRSFSTGAVHVSVRLTKKREGLNRHVMRRIKREWCPLFLELQNRDNGAIVTSRAAPADLLFSMVPDQVSRALNHFCERITGTRWSATDLRHTAAQRQVDSGASHMAVTEFLGQDSITTANVYFATSATQAERVNQAMALSPIYSKLAEVGRTRMIDKKALGALPSDQQIGGVPHGIPIAGIGACTAGQSGCKKNPILSCYTCRKFLPVNDVEIHQLVLSDLRPVVREFFDAAKGGEESPAYTQLRGTLHAAERLIAEIDPKEGHDGE